MERKFRANYHTHTYLCNHAEGEMREYVEAAVAAGLEVLGFSDHAPYVFPDGYYSGFRMKHEEQKIYVDTLLELREEYRGKIDILIGYETEYYPKHFAATLDLLNRCPCDYIIMGQHFTENEYDGVSVGGRTKNREVVRRIADQTCEAMRLGVYTYIAHPDMVTLAQEGEETYEDDLAFYVEQMRRICLCSLETDTPLEINMLGIRDGRAYPKECLISLMGEYGCKVIAGEDAHSPDVVYREEDWRRVLEYADKYGLNLIDFAPLKTPRLK